MPERRTPTRRPALAASRPTRREALTVGLAAAAATLTVAPAARAGDESEGEAMTALIGAELDAAFVYRNALLPGGLAERLAGQDHEHAQALASLLEALTMPIPGPTRGRDDLPPEALAVLDPRDAGARLQAAIAYERSLIDGCARRLAALEHANTVRTVATVMASHAQHEVELARRAGDGRVAEGALSSGS